jgi:hypothetical protein
MNELCLKINNKQRVGNAIGFLTTEILIKFMGKIRGMFPRFTEIHYHAACSPILT